MQIYLSGQSAPEQTHFMQWFRFPRWAWFLPPSRKKFVNPFHASLCQIENLKVHRHQRTPCYTHTLGLDRPSRPNWHFRFYSAGTIFYLFLPSNIVTSPNQVLLTMGMRCETVSRSTMALYSQVNGSVLSFLHNHWMTIQVVFAMLLERIFFKSYPSALSLVGTLTILTSALYVAVRPYTFVCLMNGLIFLSS